MDLDWSKFKFAKTGVPLKRDLHLVFDIEGNGFYDFITEVYVIVAQDYVTKEMYVFSDRSTGLCPKHGSLVDGVKFLIDAKKITAHNIMGYDWFVLNKFYRKLWNRKTVPVTKCHDTFVQSKCQLFERTPRRGVKGVHGLAYFGDLFGYPKPPIEDWSYWDLDKLNRCLVDVEINTRTLDYLNKEAKQLMDDFEIDFTWQINIAKYTQFRCTQQEINGFKANKTLMEQHLKTLEETIKELSDEIEPQLPFRCVPQSPKATWEEVRDSYKGFYRKVPKTEYEKARRAGSIVDVPIKLARKPTTKLHAVLEKPKDPVTKWCTKPKKDGSYTYTKAVADWFDIDVEPVLSDDLVAGPFTKINFETMYQWRYFESIATWFNIPEDPRESNYLVAGPFTRVSFEKVTLTQHDEVKKFLLTLGWKPLEWTRKKDIYGKFIKNPDGSFVKGSPQLTEKSFESLPDGLGQKIAHWNTYMHRKRTIFNDKDDEKGWLNQLRPDGRISAGARAFNTATGRMVQSGIVNNPSPSALFGKQMREVWIADEGCTLVSTDMDSAQLVLLAGFMNDPVFTKAVKDGLEFEDVPKDKHKGNFYEDNGDGTVRVYRGTDAHTVNSVYFRLNCWSDIEDARISQDHALIKTITDGRKKAKNGIYALLFGAGDSKFANTIGLNSAKEGKEIKEYYFEQLPELKAVKNRLELQYDTYRSGDGGYIQVAGGVWLYCYSKHKVLNYLLMGSEAQLQNCSIIWKCAQYEKLGIPAKQVLTVHDEQTDECPIEYEDQVKAIQSQMYYEASKILKLAVPVTGTAVSGKSYYAVH